MNAKRFFGPAYFVANAALLAAAAARAGSARRPATAVAGALLAHGGPLIFLGLLFLRRKGRTSEGLPALRTASSVGAALSAAGGAPRAGAGALLAGMGGTELYIRWYSRFGRQPSPALVVGKPFPRDVVFVDDAGQPVTVAAFAGRPAALLFYRGNWCPLCVAQIAELAERWRELQTLGVCVALISPQDEAHTQALARRFDVAFTYLRDPDLQAASALGLIDAGGVPPGIPGYDPDTVLPTVVVLDRHGTIVFCDQTDNYRVRPEPQTILSALRAAGSDLGR